MISRTFSPCFLWVAVVISRLVVGGVAAQSAAPQTVSDLAGAMEALAQKQELTVFEDGRRTRTQIAHDEVFVEASRTLTPEEAKALVDLVFPGGAILEHRERQMFVRLGQPWGGPQVLAWVEALAGGKGLPAAVQVTNLSPVLYPADQTRKDGSVIRGREMVECRMVLAPRIKLDKLLEGNPLDMLKALLGAVVPELAKPLVVGSGFQALAIQQAIKGGAPGNGTDPGISVEILLHPIPYLAPNDQFFNQQWHLLDNSTVNVNVQRVWDPGLAYFGNNIIISLLDDGLQIAHPDLDANTPALGLSKADGLHWDFIGNDADPYSTADAHGTACAGIIGATQGSARGVSGIAPKCTLLGLRMIGQGLSETDLNEAFQWPKVQIASNSWGYGAANLINSGVEGLEAARTTGRDGRGKIIVFSAGNSDTVPPPGVGGDYANFEGHLNDRVTIPVGAVGFDGERAYYSERGPCLVVCAPSLGNDGEGIVTTDLTGANGYNITGAAPNLASNNYTNTFSGTSAACPMVSGVVALMLQARPQLTWRDVQAILIKTALTVDAPNPDWITNDAGYDFNPEYGAGLVQAYDAVQEARTWTLLGPETEVVFPVDNLNGDIPDDDAGGVEYTFEVTAPRNQIVENVILTVGITHDDPRDLEIELESPAGTVSVLAESGEFSNGSRRFVRGDFGNWPFRTVFNWGENSKGTWTVRIKDLTAGTAGVVNKLTLQIFGVSAPIDSAAVISMDKGSLEVRESTGQAGLVITRDEGMSDAVTVEYETVAGTATAGADYTEVSGSIVLGPGVTKATVPVKILDEDTVEGSEDFVFRLGALSTSSTVTDPPVYGKYIETRVIIKGNDSSLLKVDPADVTMNVSESQTVANVGVTREGNLDDWSIVWFHGRPVTATPGSDYQVPRGYLLFMPGQRLNYVPFQVTRDALVETPPEQFKIEFDNPSEDIDVSVGQGNATINILDP